MNQSSSGFGAQTVNATPQVAHSFSVATDSVVRIEVRYNCIKDGDYSKVASGKLIQVFTRTSGGGLVSTSSDQNKAEVGNASDNMSTSPSVSLVANTGTNAVDLTIVGTTDTLDWDFLSNSYSS